MYWIETTYQYTVSLRKYQSFVYWDNVQIVQEYKKV